MADLIDRQAAIDALDGEIKVIGKVNAKAVLKYTKMVSDRIKALPSAQPEPKWIPVEERLPEVGKFVLVTDMYLDDVTIARFDGAWEDQHGNWSSFGCVTAWMPLPKPYERSEDVD